MLSKIIITHFQGWKRFLHNLVGSQEFSKIDLSGVYLQIDVDDKCSKLPTINTHRGILKFNWLSFGIKVTPAIFQQIMDTMLSGLDYAVAYQNDI